MLHKLSPWLHFLVAVSFFSPASPSVHPLGSSKVPCVSNCRFLTSSRTFSWSTCCKMCCRRFSWAIPIRSSFLSVSLSRARPAGCQEIKRKANEQGLEQDFHPGLGKFCYNRSCDLNTNPLENRSLVILADRNG